MKARGPGGGDSGGGDGGLGGCEGGKGRKQALWVQTSDPTPHVRVPSEQERQTLMPGRGA